jgi:hypothetical protein
MPIYYNENRQGKKGNLNYGTNANDRPPHRTPVQAAQDEPIRSAKQRPKKLAIKATTTCSIGSTNSTNTIPQQTVETNSLKVQGDKTRNITEMRHPKIWEHHFIRSLSK